MIHFCRKALWIAGSQSLAARIFGRYLTTISGVLTALDIDIHVLGL